MTLLPSLSVVVPTLNEEGFIEQLIDSLHAQSVPPTEIIVVDGGSSDRTVVLAEESGAKVIVLEGVKEWPSMNHGADLATGDVLLLTGADVTLRPKVLERILTRLAADPRLIAVGGPGIPVKPPIMLGIEYAIWNFSRWAASLLPRPYKRFASSTNLLAVRREAFLQVGGLSLDPRNADGILGRTLCELGEVHFSRRSISGRMSSRRLWKMGFWAINKHYIYVLENYFPVISRLSSIEKLKQRTGDFHSAMRLESAESVNGGASSPDSAP